MPVQERDGVIESPCDARMDLRGHARPRMFNGQNRMTVSAVKVDVMAEHMRRAECPDQRVKSR
jgi:hypothetical protein